MVSSAPDSCAPLPVACAPGRFLASVISCMQTGPDVLEASQLGTAHARTGLVLRRMHAQGWYYVGLATRAQGTRRAPRR